MTVARSELRVASKNRNLDLASRFSLLASRFSLLASLSAFEEVLKVEFSARGDQGAELVAGGDDET
jgi:hypothetical protein